MLRKILCITLLFCLISSEYLLSQVPGRMSYQGMLTGPEGNAVPDDNYSLTFKLTSSPNNNIVLWEETHSDVPVIGSVFNIILGSVNLLDLPFDEQYWMGITVNVGDMLQPLIEMTASPYSLHVSDGDIRVEDDFPVLTLNGTGASKIIPFRQGNTEQASLFYDNSFGLKAYTGALNELNTWVITDDGNFGIGTNNPVFPLEMASGAHVTEGGVWTNASSRTYKENIRNLNTGEAMTALRQLKPVKYNYKNEQDEEYLGFIAEELPALVAMKDRESLNPMDIVAVITRVVQSQQETISQLKEEINELKRQHI